MNIYELNQPTKFDLLRTASELSHPGYGAWLFDSWAELNQRYFEGELHVIPIIWGLIPHGHNLGHYDHSIPRITLHTSLLKPAGDAWGLQRLLGPVFAADVLLHEMMHQAIFQRLGHDGREKPTQTSHNNPAWCAEINRIAAVLGLPANAAVVTQRRVEGKVKWVADEGKMSRDELARWPHKSRPADYYEVGALLLMGQR